MVNPCHLNAEDRDSYKWCTFPVGSRNIPKFENITVGEVCKDIVC